MPPSCHRHPEHNRGLALWATRRRYGLLQAGLALLCLAPVVARCNASAAALPGVVRQTNNVYLVENHSSAGMVWYRSGQRGLTVVHLDAHDDCRYVAPEKIDQFRRLRQARQWDEIFRLSDLNYVSGFEVRPEDAIFDLGNFVYPTIADGIVSRFIWVVPDLAIDDRQRVRLKRHLAAALQIDEPEFTDHADGSFSFPLLGGMMVVTTLNALPAQPPGTILDLDVDFFAFAHALTDTHLKQKLQWSPETVCGRLAATVPEPALITISASVYGGYLPLTFRFLADACFDTLATGAYPDYTRQHLDAVITMRRTASPVPLPPAPGNPVYQAAHHYLAGMLDLIQRKPAAAFVHMQRAAHLSPVYRKAWLDSAEALRYMGNLEAAGESIERFERDVGHATIESVTARVHLLRLRGQLEEAERKARGLTEWNPDAHLLLLHGGVLAQMQRYDNAADVYRRILARHPQQYLATYNLAYVREQQGALNEAIAYYRATVVLRDDFAAAHENLGFLLMQQKQLTDAETHLRRALEINPLLATAWGNLGYILLETARPRDALSCFRKALSIDASLSKAHDGLAAAKAAVDSSSRE